MTSILEAFDAAVARHPQRIAIIDGQGRSVTFAQLHSRANGLARTWHRRGVGRGDRVLLAMRVDADLYASLAALWSLGATVVLPEPSMGLAGLRHAIRISDVTAFCSSGPFRWLRFIIPGLWGARHLRPVADLGDTLCISGPDTADIALISFTSGTSGAPKAIPRSHGFLMAQHQAVAPLLDSMDAERDLVAFPVFVLINLAAGRTSVLPNWKMSQLGEITSAGLVDWVAQQKITRVLLPPSLCEVLTQGPLPASLHTIFTGGGPVFPHLLKQLTSARPDLRIVCVYGSTEAEPIAHLDAADISLNDFTKMSYGHGLLVGEPVADIQLRIADGEIQVAGPHVNSGYLNPRDDAENKVRDNAVIWHRTGDAGFIDERGRLWLLGRMGAEVSSHGRHVHPFSIEVAASAWPGVTHCALMPIAIGAGLIIQGNRTQLDGWRQRAEGLGIDHVHLVDHIPMDRRHASKVDRKALAQHLRNVGISE